MLLEREGSETKRAREECWRQKESESDTEKTSEITAPTDRTQLGYRSLAGPRIINKSTPGYGRHQQGLSTKNKEANLGVV